MSSKAIIAALVGAIFSFLAGWVVYGILLMDFYTANTIVYEGLAKGPMPDLVFIFISGLFNTLLVSVIFSKWAHVKTFKGGFINGMIIYFLITGSVDLGHYAFYNLMNLTLIIADIIVGTIFGGLVCGVIGAVLGMGKKE